METVENKYITVAYKLYTMEYGEKELFEEAKAEHPFQFISGLGTTLEDFENQITALSKGDKFDFTIPADKAYGQYDEQHVIDLIPVRSDWLFRRLYLSFSKFNWMN